MFDYLMAGKPIVMSVDGIHSPVHELGLALTSEPENPSAIAQAIEEAAALEPSRLEEIALKSPAFVKEHHHYQHLGELFAKTLE